MCGGGDGGVGEVDSSRVKVTSMIEGFAGVLNFPFRDFSGGKIWQIYFWVP